jgi:hypothetical protein
VSASEYLDVVTQLRDDASLGFEQLVDLCGVDYQTYGDGALRRPAFRGVLHLLSMCEQLARAPARVRAGRRPAAGARPWSISGVRPTGTSAKRSTCTASSSKATPTCAAF